jgi:hypothetical protein
MGDDETVVNRMVRAMYRKSERLNALKTHINEEHRRCEEAVGAALEHAINAGEGLVEMKQEVAHGTWGRWLAENFEGSERTAQAYMRLYQRRDEIRNGAADLSIRGALSSLSIPKPSAAEVEKQVVVEAVAEANEITLETARSEYRHDVLNVREAVEREQERREEKGQAFAAEERAEYARRLAEKKKLTRERAAREREERRAQHTAMFMEVDADLSKALRLILEATEKQEGVEFTEEEVELLEREYDAISGVARIGKSKLTGDSGTDWDAELAQIEEWRQWGE